VRRVDVPIAETALFQPLSRAARPPKRLGRVSSPAGRRGRQPRPLGLSTGRQALNDRAMPLEGLFGDRHRASSFGSVAKRYDRYRSGYPNELVDDLVATRPRSALDVGCGTGKLARALITRGVDVLGVDPDERMAAIARQHGVPVEVATFENWDAHGRTFDLITSGHAWHWIDPKLGQERATQLLRPGAAIARCWNYHAVDEPLLADFEDAYRRCAPGIQVIGRDPSALPDGDDPLTALPAFDHAERRTYRWVREMSAEEWIGLISTFSDHNGLSVDQFRDLAEHLEQAIAEHGGTVRARGGTYLLLASRSL